MFRPVEESTSALALLFSEDKQETDEGPLSSASNPHHGSENGGRTHVVLLVHGIRTQSEWAQAAAAILETGSTIRVRPTRYEFFDVVRFLAPSVFRRKPIKRITDLIRDELSKKPEKLSVVAHSFGTYIVSRILEAETDIRFHRIILCGSIVPDDFNWARFKHRIGPTDTADWQIVNDCGMADILPVLAKSVTWGYGSSGRFGFGHGRVKDRFFDCGHSGFFQAGFIQRYWLPYLETGKIEEGAVSRATNPLWVSLLTVLKIRYLLVALLVMGFLFGVGTFIGSMGASEIRPRARLIGSKVDCYQPDHSCTYDLWIEYESDGGSLTLTTAKFTVESIEPPLRLAGRILEPSVLPCDLTSLDAVGDEHLCTLGYQVEEPQGDYLQLKLSAKVPEETLRLMRLRVELNTSFNTLYDTIDIGLPWDPREPNSLADPAAR